MGPSRHSHPDGAEPPEGKAPSGDKEWDPDTDPRIDEGWQGEFPNPGKADSQNDDRATEGQSANAESDNSSDAPEDDNEFDPSGGSETADSGDNGFDDDEQGESPDPDTNGQ